MGIQVTNFNRDVLEKSKDETARSCFYKKNGADELTAEETGPDYESIMDNARGKVNNKREILDPPVRIFLIGLKVTQVVASRRESDIAFKNPEPDD